MKIHIISNVLEAYWKRLQYIFSEFDNILIAFSGGKDSGVLLHLTLEYMRQNGITKKIGVFHQDFEAQYQATTDYVTAVMTSNLDLIEPYWSCMPMKCKTATSMFEQYWTPWEESKQEIWVRPMPTYAGVINQSNHSLDFWYPEILQEDFYTKFNDWFHRVPCKGEGKTACLVGLRASESLNRYRTIDSGRVNTYNRISWSTKVSDNVYSMYPLYDWQTEDIWIANAKYGFPYNRLYDLFHLAGVPLHSMRVASPFNDWAVESLKLYRAIEPDTWGSMVGRVNGANFSAIYGGTKQMAWKNIEKPDNHTWQSYVQFLLSTLPEETRKTYEEKFATSIEFWRTRGGVLSAETIQELRETGIPIQLNGKSNYNTDKERVLFQEYPDDAKVKEFSAVPSYKRMAICILKNDHLCKYMGFGMTKAQSKRRKEALEKYKDL